jgi:UDP-2,3-diacylglucosamine hydrolase
MRTYTYFISDMHLGLPLYDKDERERRVVRWLDSVKPSATDIYLLGDIFDFWWEYKYVVPRGYVRFLGKLAELTDCGVKIHLFAGNHDLWVKNYLTQECGVSIHHSSQELRIGSKTFFLAHGDRLGKTLTPLQRFFSNRLLQRLFSMLHPRWGFAIGYAWSKLSRQSRGIFIPWRGENEQQFQLSAEMAQRKKIDYFVLGHRHTPLQADLPNGAQLFVLGDWLIGSSYAEFDGEKLELKEFETS